MTPRPLHLLTLAVAVCGLLAWAPGADAAKKSRKAAHTSHTVAKPHGAKVKPPRNDSGETTAERERRLYRECQGMPNAGACLGYTRK